MSAHWNPKDDLVQTRQERVKPRWPEGATAGLILVAAGCIGMALLLYRLAGPSDVFSP